MKNNFPFATDLSSASDAFEVTPADDTDLAQVPRALYVGSDGNLSLRFPSGDVTFVGVLAGTLLPVRPTRVLAATTATNILALV